MVNLIAKCSSALKVGDLFSVLGAHGIERQLRRVAGVGQPGLRLDDFRVLVIMGPGISKSQLTGNGPLSE